MLRFVARYGLVRIAGRRVVPALMIWDAMVMANKIRRIPVVDHGLRRGAGAARRGVTGAMTGRPRSARTRPPWTPGTDDGSGETGRPRDAANG
jgi:hypothetical protein